jgi:hypothetical protein
MEFLVFDQTAREEMVGVECTNMQIIVETIIEESKINTNQDHVEFFIFCMN